MRYKPVEIPFERFLSRSGNKDFLRDSEVYHRRSPWHPAKLPRAKSNDHKFSLFEISRYFNPESRPGGSLPTTLNASAANPTGLAYVVLFYKQNPRWDNDGIIFAKSNLSLIPGYAENKPASHAEGEASELSQSSPSPETGEEIQQTVSRSPGSPLFKDIASRQYAPANPNPIAVFYQAAPSKKDPIAEFAGWYELDVVSCVPPRSYALMALLRDKWGGDDARRRRRRRRELWEQSAQVEWAAIWMKRMKDTDAPPTPLIERWNADETSES
jgi:hypothetical protein